MGEAPEPTVAGPVRAYIRELNQPFVLGEIWRPLKLERMKVRRVLERMVAAGELTKHKIPIKVTAVGGPHRGLQAWNRMAYLYALTEGYE